jgi:hypothetical protein
MVGCLSAGPFQSERRAVRLLLKAVWRLFLLREPHISFSGAVRGGRDSRRYSMLESVLRSRFQTLAPKLWTIYSEMRSGKDPEIALLSLIVPRGRVALLAKTYSFR